MAEMAKIKATKNCKILALHALKYLFLYISKVLHALKYLFLFFFSLFFAFGIGCRHKEEVIQQLIKEINHHSPHHHSPNHHSPHYHSPNHHSQQQQVNLHNGSIPPNQPLMHLERYGIQGPHHPKYFLNFP